MKDISTAYEELRQSIDGGSESMTHEDALAAVKYWQAEIDELRAALAERDAEIESLKAERDALLGAVGQLGDLWSLIKAERDALKSTLAHPA